MTIEVVEPGLLDTVQDAGRPDWTDLGVPVGGASDTWSLEVANLLVGNEPGAAALEMTLVGPTLTVREGILVGLAGADLGGLVRETGRRLEPGRAHRLVEGWTIAFPGNAEPGSGARAYLAPSGGIDVPLVLGSASTVLVAGFGGHEGRALRAGDRITARVSGRAPTANVGSATSAAPGSADPSDRRWPPLAGDPFATPPGSDEREAPIRIVAGPGRGADRLVEAVWRVAPGSDRTGLRLTGPSIETPAGSRAGRELLSHGVVWGAVQVPPDGGPIVLLADHQTTGGYPVVAVAIAADRPRLGQLRPGAELRFELVGIDDAREALRRQRASLAEGARLLREDAGWDALWRSAGG